MRRTKKESLAEFNKESEKDMRKEWISAAVGIGLVFLTAIAFMCFCRYTDGREKADQDANKVYSFSGREEKYVDAKIKYADERGFAVYKQLPESVAKLVNTGIFAPTEEEVKRYMEIYGDDEGFVDDEEYNDDEADGDLLQSDYDSEVEEINKIGTASYLKELNHIGPALGGSMYCFLTWDESAGKFADTDKIAEIEQCGFFGFSGLMAEAEKMIQDRRVAAKNEDTVYWDEEQCKIYCQGVEFDLVWCPVQKYYRLLCPVNTAVYYIPEKYRNVIDEVMGIGGYIPHYYSIGGKKEVLIFNRDNSIECGSAYPCSDAGSESYDNKRIAFIYEDGKLVDYYVTTQKNKLELDDVDKKILDQCVSGLGKTLSEYGEQLDVSNHEVRLYRAE